MSRPAFVLPPERYSRDWMQGFIYELEGELAEEIKALGMQFDPTTVKLETETIKPYKKNIDVRTVCLVWLPYDRNGEKAW